MKSKINLIKVRVSACALLLFAGCHKKPNAAQTPTSPVELSPAQKNQDLLVSAYLAAKEFVRLKPNMTSEELSAKLEAKNINAPGYRFVRFPRGETYYSFVKKNYSLTDGKNNLTSDQTASIIGNEIQRVHALLLGNKSSRIGRKDVQGRKIELEAEYYEVIAVPTKIGIDEANFAYVRSNAISKGQVLSTLELPPLDSSRPPLEALDLKDVLFDGMGTLDTSKEKSKKVEADLILPEAGSEKSLPKKTTPAPTKANGKKGKTK